ncbi:hypothetical protein C8J55DRAFT_533997 [Lentinula edodes]|uniref:Uncharacterized protein n=1 Tax=Lentinula lateritia TaxID=40482 RepID=A0A9W9AWJ1_9AGAR|nr:hypothetical protein C8J55DRAFT_533997 [Lentinula edodes]
MLLDLISNLPRLRLSSAHFKLILWLLRDSGVPNVPSYYAFQKMQAELQKTCGHEPQPFKSVMGNYFYVNDPRDAVKRNFANPQVAKHMNYYPEEVEGPISEVWQAGCHKEYHPSKHTPMLSMAGKQFYIEEVAMLNNDRLVIPRCWIKQNGVVYADAHQDGKWEIQLQPIRIPSEKFKFSYLDIEASLPDHLIPWKDSSLILQMPNPNRKLVPTGYDLYDVFIPLWADDVSGNKSKQYNKHINMYSVNSNLPGQLLHQEYFVQFVSTSPNATSPEQFSALKDMINDTHQHPVICYNAETRRMCGVRLHVPTLPADNPQQAEEACHAGGNANLLCRKCDAGGTYEETESDEGYHALYGVGIAWSAAQTREQLTLQLKAATLGVKSEITQMQCATGTKDKVAQYWIDILLEKSIKMKKDNPNMPADEITATLETWLDNQPGDKINPLLDIADLDPTQDTPVEILHTILLGVVKYVWHMFHTSLSIEQKNLSVVRLQSTDLDGLTVPPLRAAYMMQYNNNLIGKHFKTLMQTMSFHVHDMVTPAQFQLIQSVGELGAMLWIHEINNLELYLKDLEIIIGNTLDAFAAVDPAKIINKVKIHLLNHIVPDIRRFGPIIRNSTEVFECFNAIFRMCSVFSNGQAPSRDIACQFAGMDRVKHILSGGYWVHGSGQWVQAGPRVQEVLTNQPIIQCHLGWIPKEAIKIGHMKPLAQKKTQTVLWSTTKAALVLEQDWRFWHNNISVIAKSGDCCKIGSWVAVQKKLSTEFHIGRIAELLSPFSPTTNFASERPENVITIEDFILGPIRHPQFNMPVLHKQELGAGYFTVNSSEILFRLSVQHDCRSMHCSATGTQAVIQEHEATERTTHYIEHVDDKHFVINMHSLHNANLIRALLPHNLTEPKPLHSDRERWHHKGKAGKNPRKEKKDSQGESKAERSTAGTDASSGSGWEQCGK